MTLATERLRLPVAMKRASLASLAGAGLATGASSPPSASSRAAFFFGLQRGAFFCAQLDFGLE